MSQCLLFPRLDQQFFWTCISPSSHSHIHGACACISFVQPHNQVPQKLGRPFPLSNYFSSLGVLSEMLPCAAILLGVEDMLPETGCWHWGGMLLAHTTLVTWTTRPHPKPQGCLQSPLWPLLLPAFWPDYWYHHYCFTSNLHYQYMKY